MVLCVIEGCRRTTSRVSGHRAGTVDMTEINKLFGWNDK